MPSDESDILGLSVSYDARERLQVASTKRWSLAAIHLRSGDTIKAIKMSQVFFLREVNGQPVASKSMLRYRMLASMEKNGFVELLVHSDDNQNNPYEHEIEMPEDVIDIAVKQIQTMRTLSSKQLQKTKKILRKDLPLPRYQRPVAICDNTFEVPIGSDWDPKKLCKVKKSQGY
uniref:Uncharacterized protein n=1 Tax=Setaria digitata TaxID=48799 RepID=A0A915PI71_9BILA